MEAEIIDPYERRKRLLAEDITYTLGLVARYADEQNGADALSHLRDVALERRSDSVLLRERLLQDKSLSDVVRWAAELWMRGEVAKT